MSNKKEKVLKFYRDIEAATPDILRHNIEDRKQRIKKYQTKIDSLKWDIREMEGELKSRGK